MIKWACILIFPMLFQSCASILKLDRNSGFVRQAGNQSVSCVKDYKILWKNFGFNREFVNDKPDSKFQEEEKKIIDIEVNKLFSNVHSNKCVDFKKAMVEISNTPSENRNKALLLFNLLSIGIIPYWAEYTNTLSIKIYSQNSSDSEVVNLESRFVYTRMQSVFLWPATPFYDTSENEINIKTIPMHFNSISEEMHKGSGVK